MKSLMSRFAAAKGLPAAKQFQVHTSRFPLDDFPRDFLSMYLLALDSTGTQPYIFGSNRLRHNIGASHLVARATGRWALQAVVRAASPRRTNVKDAAALDLHDSDDPKYWIEENSDLAAEVLYAGGGNVVVLFREKRVADDFRGCLSQWLIERAPGLTLVENGQAFDWESDEQGPDSTSTLSNTLDAVLRELGRKKAARRVPSRPVGRSVTQPGQIHGQPAVALQDLPGADEDESDEDPYPISSEAKAKEDHLHRANQRLEARLPPPDRCAYPFKLDNLGQAEGEQSFIAVVHADGDRMGTLLQTVARTPPLEAAGGPNRAFIRRIREFSEAVREAALGAMKDVVEGLHAFIQENGNDDDEEVELPGVKAPLQLEKRKRDGRLLLPLRPIVFGGDDVTFVCDGRLGPALAVRYVRCFETRAEESDLLQSLPKATASAGVSIVKTHYPFSLAYDLAGELTRSAKDQRQEDSGPVGSYMDWHVALDDLAGSLDAVRAPYHLPARTGPRSRSEQHLTVRPVAVTGGKDGAVNRWSTIRSHIQDFRKTGHARSKVKELREKLRQGPESVEAFVTEHGLDDLLDGNPRGFQGSKTPYLDVLELTDLALLDDELERCDSANTSAPDTGER